MSHLDDGVLHELLDGEIPSSELGPIQQHLASCAACRERLAAERALTDGVDELVALIDVPAADAASAATAPRRREPRTRWPRDLMWAAMVLIAAGTGYALHRPQPNTTVATAGHPTGVPSDTGTRTSLAEQDAAQPTPAPQVAARSAKPHAPDTTSRVAANVAPAASAPAALQATDRLRDVARIDSPANNAALAETRRRDVAAKTVASAVDSDRSRAVGTLAMSNAAAPPAAPPTNALVPRDVMGSVVGGRGGGGGGRGGGRGGRGPAPLPIDTVGFPEAVRRLGGSLRLIDGLVPLRLESQGMAVRVVYPLGDSLLVLREELIDGKVITQLLAPANIAADSLAKLRARIRE